MTNENVELLKQLFKANADKQMSLSTVISTSITALRADKYSECYAELVGKGAQRAHFISLFMDCMPHVTYNGDKKATVVDWVECKDVKKANKPFAEYRLTGENKVELEECAMYIAVDGIEYKKTEQVKLASGYTIEVLSRDAEGNYITETKTVNYVPRVKTVWGYTETVMKAFIAALDVLEKEQVQETTESEQAAA